MNLLKEFIFLGHADLTLVCSHFRNSMACLLSEYCTVPLCQMLRATEINMVSAAFRELAVYPVTLDANVGNSRSVDSTRHSINEAGAGVGKREKDKATGLFQRRLEAIGCHLGEFEQVEEEKWFIRLGFSKRKNTN